MIKITIETNGKKVFSRFEHENSTLIENSLAIRYLEEMKLKLLDEFEYKPEFEISEGDQVEDENEH
jgi:hypothetical protein